MDEVFWNKVKKKYQKFLLISIAMNFDWFFHDLKKVKINILRKSSLTLWLLNGPLLK